MNKPQLYLGIDTGGTYTDGVLFDPLARKVVRSDKVLTSHHDLKICIHQVLQRLLVEDGSPTAGQVAMVSLSTTLATNAIAEGRRRPVGLLLLGYDPQLVKTFKFDGQFGTPHFVYVSGRHDLSGMEQVALDETGVEQAVNLLGNQVDAIAIASYAGPVNNDHEQRATRIVSSISDLPVVQAHHLSSELDSIRRATTASLNASLLTNAQEFLVAVSHMLLDFGVHCPVLVVRGDGSLAGLDFARQRPVEIIHSGPATSAIGGQFLAGVSSALVLDIGGTTTDLAMIENGRVKIEPRAATVGNYRTCVRTVQVRSIGLGGDSLIRFDHLRNLQIGPERVMPLTYLCHNYPEAAEDLHTWLAGRERVRYSDRLEYWVLRREPDRLPGGAATQVAIDLLRQGPQRLSYILKTAGVLSPVQLYVDDLVNRDVIQRAALTPTDLLHVSGEFMAWDVKAAHLVARAAAQNWDENEAQFAERVRHAIARRIVAEIVTFTSGFPLSTPGELIGAGKLDRWLFEESLDGKSPFLGCRISLKTPLVGIGAPAKAYMPLVAEMLGTELILPEHYAVANAVGTVVGNILLRDEADIFPALTGANISGYFVRMNSTQNQFSHYADAEYYACHELESQLRQRCQAAGAKEIILECKVQPIWDGMTHLTATAAGKPDLG
jgi:N-methylhydantoinase A/oxoprolinase/acetone carboxylase beta subunit